MRLNPALDSSNCLTYLMDRLKKGDEVFVCFRWQRDNPRQWRDCTICSASQQYFRVQRGFQGERFRQKDWTTATGIYLAFIPTPEERILWAETQHKDLLISELSRQDWDKFTISQLETIVATVKECQRHGTTISH